MEGTSSFLFYKMESSALLTPPVRVEKYLLPEVLASPAPNPVDLCVASQISTLPEFPGLLAWFLKSLSNAEKHENFEGPSIMNSLYFLK